MFIYCINYTIFTSKKIAYFSKKKKALNTQKPYYFLNTTNLLKI